MLLNNENNVLFDRIGIISMIIMIIMIGIIIITGMAINKSTNNTRALNSKEQFLKGQLLGQIETKQEAIRAGVAKYYIADELTGIVEFRWIKDGESIKISESIIPDNIKDEGPNRNH